jgi:hypothetical protein
MRCGSSTCLKFKWGNECGAERCGYSTRLIWGNQSGAGMFIWGSICCAVQCGSSTYMLMWGNQCGAVSLHTYLGNRPNFLPEMYSTIVYTEIIGDSNNYKNFGLKDSKM